MNEKMYEIIAAVVGAIIAGLIGWFISWCQWRRSIKDNFIAVIAQQHAKIDTWGPPRGFDVFYDESIPILTEAVYRVRSGLFPCSWNRLTRVLQEYKAASRHQFSPAESLGAFIETQQKPQTMLHDWLDRFYDCVANIRT